MIQRNRRSGFTVLEMTLSAAVLVVMAKFTVDALRGLHDTTTATTVKARMQRSGEEALLSILADLNASGFVAANGKSYPYLDFLDGTTGSVAFQNHDHAAANHQAAQGDPDFGPTREIVFLRPADADGDEIPDLDPTTGALTFDATEISYVLVTSNGRNVLERRLDGAPGVPVAYDVERVTFEDALVSGGNLPADSIRVRIWFRARDEQGVVQQHLSEATVRLRNG
jgi:hypothetical protein